jgi:hypothetical protein
MPSAGDSDSFVRCPSGTWRGRAQGAGGSLGSDRPTRLASDAVAAARVGAWPWFLNIA